MAKGVPYEVVQIESKDSVIIVPEDSEGYVNLIVESRPPYGKFLAFPAGKIEDGESPMEAAIREMQEESGLIACSIRELGCKRLFHHICSEVVHIFVATVDPDTRLIQTLNPGEMIEETIIRMDWKELRDLVDSPRLDGVSMTAALWALLDHKEGNKN